MAEIAMGRAKRRMDWALMVLALGALGLASGAEIEHSAVQKVGPGDVVTVKFTGDPGGRAVLSFGEKVKDVAMREAEPGVYVAEYTVRKGQELNGEAVIVGYTAKDGRRMVIQAPNRIGEPPPPPSAAAAIESVRHNAQGWLKAGAVVAVTVEGTRGAKASFDIVGVAKDIPLREDRPGHYIGAWAVPAANQPLVAPGTPLIARLQVGDVVDLKEAPAVLAVDNVPPEIGDLVPAAEATLASDRPVIAVVAQDRNGAGVDPQTIRLQLDGADVTGATSFGGAVVRYVPPAGLRPGPHEVSLTLADAAGNPASQTWRFTVAPPPPVKRTLTHTAVAKVPEPGEVITVRLTAEPGGRATFSIGEKVRGVAMRVAEPGVYVGEYTVRRGDDLAGQKVVVTFVAPDGKELAVEAAEPVATPQVAPAALKPPVIAEPKDGDKVRSPLVIKGAAERGQRVRIRIVARTRVLLEFVEELPEVIVDVNDRGEWQTPPIELTRPMIGAKTTYTITVTALAGDKESEKTEIAVTR